MKTLAIIGAGQIGSRHLQALARMDRPVRIQLIDPSQESLNRAKERFEQVNDTTSSNVAGLELLTSLEQAATEIDVALVATTADQRRDVTEKLLSRSRVRNLVLEKIVFQRAEDFSAMGDLFEKKQVNVWVNCPFRMWPGYQRLAAKKPRNLQFQVTGTNWGLACNSIHYFDIFSYLTSSGIDSVSSDGLNPGTIPSKRPGFFELTGSLMAKTQNGRATLTSFPEGATPASPVVVHMSADGFHCTVREDRGQCWIAERETGWAVKEEAFPTPFQSQLTQIAYQQILDDGPVALPDFKASRDIHIPLLRAISNHLGDASTCPIT